MSIGIIHSFQTMGAVDGPGIRFVIFLQGCPLRCVYCQNPDTWNPGQGTEYGVGPIVDRVLRYKPYFGERGGVTVSGGEALMQIEFVTELFTALKKLNIHTCLDTSGLMASARDDLYSAEKLGHTQNLLYASAQDAKILALLKVTDLVICDIKFTSESLYTHYTGGSLASVFQFLSATEQAGTDLWVRHVVVPEMTDSPEEVNQVINYARNYSNLKRIELLPFRKFCSFKYEELGLRFACEDIPECNQKTIDELTKLIPAELRG